MSIYVILEYKNYYDEINEEMTFEGLISIKENFGEIKYNYWRCWKCEKICEFRAKNSIKNKIVYIKVE